MAIALQFIEFVIPTRLLRENTQAGDNVLLIRRR